MLDKEFIRIEEAAKYADDYVLRHVKAITNIKPKQALRHSSPSHKDKLLTNTTGHRKKGEVGSTHCSSVIKPALFCGKSGYKAYFCWNKLLQNDKPKAVLTASKIAEAEGEPSQTDKQVALILPPGVLYYPKGD